VKMGRLIPSLSLPSEDSMKRLKYKEDIKNAKI